MEGPFLSFASMLFAWRKEDEDDLALWESTLWQGLNPQSLCCFHVSLFDFFCATSFPRFDGFRFCFHSIFIQVSCFSFLFLLRKELSEVRPFLFPFHFLHVPDMVEDNRAIHSLEVLLRLRWQDAIFSLWFSLLPINNGRSDMHVSVVLLALSKLFWLTYHSSSKVLTKFRLTKTLHKVFSDWLIWLFSALKLMVSKHFINLSMTTYVCVVLDMPF